MSSKQMVVGVAALALLMSVGLVLPAADEDRLASGTTVDFTVPTGTIVVTENGTEDIVVFTRDDGVVDSGNCGGEVGTLHAAVVVHPDSRGNYRPELIEAVVVYPSVVPPGTRLGSLQQLGPCESGGGSLHDKIRGVVE